MEDEDDEDENEGDDEGDDECGTVRRKRTARGNESTRTKNCPSAILSTTNPT
jgi:hypothetical protein